jgi:iron complex outermembrane receptor protein
LAILSTTVGCDVLRRRYRRDRVLQPADAGALPELHDGHRELGRVRQGDLAPDRAAQLHAGGRYTSDEKRFDGVSNVYILFLRQPAPPQDFCPTLPFAPLVSTEAEFRSFYAAAGIPITPVPLFVLRPSPEDRRTAPFVLFAPIVINDSLKNDKFTYRLAAQYELTRRNMIYASFETGYHAGGFSFARGISTYNPETIKAFTLGSKNRFLDNRLQVNVEAFLWKYKDQQFSQFGYDLGNPPSTVFLTRNIGDSTIKGVDLDLDSCRSRTPPCRRTSSISTPSTTASSITRRTRGCPPNTTCPFTPTTQTTPGGTISVFQIDCSGNVAFNSPKWSFNLNGEQTIPLGMDFKAVLVAGDALSFFELFSADYLPYLKSPSTFVSYASLTLGREDDSLWISFYVNNIENNRRLIGGTTNSAGLIAASAEQPRTYGVRIGGEF